MAIQALMLDSELVRSVVLLAEPTLLPSVLSTSDHDIHRPASLPCGAVIPVSNTVGAGGGCW